jgi:hypothetical protein
MMMEVEVEVEMLVTPHAEGRAVMVRYTTG